MHHINIATDFNTSSLSFFRNDTKQYAKRYYPTKQIVYTTPLGKVLPYSLPSVEPGADPGVQAVSPQVTISHPPVVGCHYFLPGRRFTFVSVHQMATHITEVIDI